MAYETYSTVSWSDGTPISSDRLQQMSSNIDLVKTVTDNYARGVLSYKSTAGLGSAINDATETILIALDNLSGGLNYTVTAASERYIKITFNTPGLLVANGDENCNYVYKLKPNADGTGVAVAEWHFGMPGQDVMDGASATVTDNSSANQVVLLASGLTVMAADKKVGGGTFAVLVDTGATGLTNQEYSITVQRSIAGTAIYKRIGVVVTQLYAEDCGATV